jgi:hypothetical protein
VLALISLTDGSRRDLQLPFTASYLKKFDASGRSISMLGWDKSYGSKSMYSVPFDGGAPRLVAPLMTTWQGQINGSSFLWAPDGSSFLYASSAPAAPTISFLMLDWSNVTKVPSPMR